MRRLAQLGLLLVVGMACAQGIACSHDPLAFDIAVPSALSSSAKWIEVAAFRGAQCASLASSLNGGIPEGYTTRYAFQRGDTSAAAPSFGDVPNDKYAFAAVARDENCAVIAAGCTDIDVGDASAISISLIATGAPTGACAAGSICEAAKCVPANDNSDPTVGANCSLELLGAGPLANTAGVDNTLVSAPAIASTDKGFVIVYREIDGSTAGTGGARLVVLNVDGSGGASRPERRALKDRCSSSNETDGVGLAVNGNDGLAVFSKAPCESVEHPEPSLQVATFKIDGDTPGIPTVTKLFDSPSPDTVNRITLGAAKPATQKKSANIVVFTQNGTGNIANLDPASGAKGPNGTFGGTGVTDTWVAANDRVLALLSVGVGDPGVIPIEEDAGSEDGGTIIGSTSDTTLRLLLLDPKTDIQTIKDTGTRPVTFPGKFGSIATTGGRVLVITGNEGIGRSVTYHAFDFGKEQEADSSGFTVEQPSSTSKSKVVSADVTIQGNRAFMVGLQQGQIGLQVYDNATTQLTALRNVQFSRQTRISGISTVRDGAVSVAASDTRVAVVWTTAKVLTQNDAAGGYAIFACTK